MAFLRRRKEGRASPWAFFKDFPRVMHYLKPHKRLAAASLSLVAGGSAMALLAPWPLAILIDTVLGNKPLPSLLGFLGGLSQYQLLAVAVASGLVFTALEHGLGVIDNYVNTKLDLKMVLGLRSDLFRHAHRLSMAWHDKTRTGALMFQINNQASHVGAITVAIPPLLQSVVTLIGMFVVVYLIQPGLALLSLSVVPFIYYSAGYYARRIQPRVLRVRHLEGTSLAIVHEAMEMIKVIVAFGREPYEYGRFRSQAEVAVDARVDLTVRQTMFSLAVTMTTAVGTALVLGFGAYGVLQHKLTAGELLVVMGYIGSLYKPLEQISNTVSTLQEQFIGLRGALNVLDTEPDIHERAGARGVETVEGRVTYSNVEFSYAGRKGTLKDVSFDAPPGSRVAIVGPTGAGKSTMLHLLPRFYDPKEGAVLLDGVDVRELRIESLRAQISVVQQEPMLFSGTIRDNITYGRLDAPEADIVAAAQAANAHDFVTALPKGYLTELGERGPQLSGGERQRISVARAFLKDAPILILDEPTSAIDSKTEGVILEALERLMEGRTTFMVAHRLSTIRDADLILVVNHGAVVEQGTHEELLAKRGLYTELYEAQHGAPRRRAAATVSSEGLSELTKAIAEGREGGVGIQGPALAEMARAMATRDSHGAALADDGKEAVWLLVGATWPLLRDGSPERLQQLAARDGHANGNGNGNGHSHQNGNGNGNRNGSGIHGVDEAARMARRLLADLGLHEQTPAEPAPARARPEREPVAALPKPQPAPEPVAERPQPEPARAEPAPDLVAERPQPVAEPPQRVAEPPRSAPEPQAPAAAPLPSAPAPARPAPDSSKAAVSLVPILNNAGVEELLELPGVGRRAAERIVSYREANGPFASEWDLMRVEGFDDHRVHQIKTRIAIHPVANGAVR
jgi:ATP-binding cassette subfamily B protein